MARGTMRTTASRPSAGTSKKLTGSNEIKPFRDNESSDPYYDPQWDNPYQRESTPVNEDPKRKADRERQQRIDEKNWDNLTKKKKQEDFNLDLTGSVGFSHEIVDLGGSSISFTAGIDFLPGPDIKIGNGKASVGAGIGISRIAGVNGGLVIDLETKEVTGISGGLAAFGLGIEFSSEKCHTTVTITLAGIGITYGQDTCKEKEEKEEGKEIGEEPPQPEIPPLPEPNAPAINEIEMGRDKPPGFKNKGYGLYAFFLLSYYDRTVIDGEYLFFERYSTRLWGYAKNWRNDWILISYTDFHEKVYRFQPPRRYTAENAANIKKAYLLESITGEYLILGDGDEIADLWSNSIVGTSRAYSYSSANYKQTLQSTTSLHFVGFIPYPSKERKKYNNPIPLPEKDEVCDLSPILSLQRKANEMLTQGLQIQQQSAAAIGVGAFPATYPGSLTTNKGTKQVKNLAEQVDIVYDTIDELLGKYPQKHKVKRKNKDGKDEEMDFEIPNQSEGQAELLGMMMQSLQQTSNSNNMENRQLQELALTRQMVVKLYYMVESIMEYLDYPTETTVVNLPMSITPMKRKGNQIEKLKEFGDMVKESIQPVIVTKKKSGDPETLKKYLLHLTHGAAIIKAAFWRKLSPENPKEQINTNLAKQEKLSELSSTEKAWNEALEVMAGKLDPENEAEAKKNAPKIEVEKKPGAK